MYENNERPKRESHVSAAIAGGVVGGIIVAIILVAVLYFTGTLGGGTRTETCLLYTSPSPRDRSLTRKPN